MSVLGTQLVFSMVMASVLSKLSAHFSLGSWILTSRLVRYLHPTDDELRSLTGMPATGYSKNKGRKNYKKYAAKDEPFTVPKSLDIQLEAAKVQPIDVMPMKFYSEFQWLIDFAFCALFIYVATEAYYALVQPRNEYNLSMMWAVLVIGFCLKVLYSLTAMYFNKDGDGEWVICVVLGLFFLVFAMVILIVNDEILEFELDAAYRNFSAGAKEMLAKQGIDSEGPASLLTFRIMLAIIAALLGSFLSFPGLRLAKMHLDSLKYARERPFLQLLLYTNMVFPLLLSIMWVRPVIREQLVYTQSNNNSSTYLIKPQTFEAARIIAIIFFCVLRFCLTWTHLQSHLNMACAKMEELKKEAGRISSLELQKRVARVFYYLCVVALQYVVPLILLLYCTIMWKTLGDFSWADAFGIHSVAANSTSSSIKQPPLSVEGEATIAASAAQFSFALRNLQIIFTPVWFRGLFSFLCWWICTAWFTTSAFGLVYYSYFTM